MKGLSSEEATRAVLQAGMSAADHMGNAVNYIEQRFGPGYAEEHPELVVAFMQAAATNYHAWAVMAAADTISDAIERRAP